ncbi:Rho GTPase activation protein [Umbelopsis sp. PMI_123]|nr:Rho GTPase activation protein [Umbelopsis sp. PMI_123]
MNLVVISPDQFAQSGPAPEKSLIFGASLHEILERAPFTTKGGLCIPLVLHRCFSEISKKGIRSEGLFRLSGSAPKIHQLENLFSREPDFGKNVDLSPYDVHTLAGTFKKLLRSLPEPVIPHHLHIYYLNGFNKSASDEENLAILSSLGHRMDAQHFDLLKYIIAVASYVEREQKNNKMTAEALAIVLAPTCTGLDGIINKLPVNKNKMTVSLGRASTSRPISSSNVLQLSIVKDLEQWTALFQFMITFHEELLNNWTGATDNEKQVS